MGACFHTESVTCDNCRQTKAGGYIPAVPFSTLPYSPPVTVAANTAHGQLRERRERIATAALSGILANPKENLTGLEREWHAAEAVRYADALIAELDKDIP